MSYILNTTKNISDNEFPLDDIGGPLTMPSDSAPNYNYKKMREYCRQKNISVESLTDEQLKEFEL